MQKRYIYNMLNINLFTNYNNTNDNNNNNVTLNLIRV